MLQHVTAKAPASWWARRRSAAAKQRESAAVAAVLDLDWYIRETGTSFATVAEAAEHYQHEGDALGFSPHPLFSPTTMSGASGQTKLGAYLLRTEDRPATPHPAWACDEYVRRNPGASAHPFGPLGHLAEALGPDTTIHLATLAKPTPARWGDVRERWEAANEAWAHSRRMHQPTWLNELPDDHHAGNANLTFGPDAPLVSIVMPTWNRPDATARALASIQAQTWQHWEAIVVDDGSVDHTCDVVRALANDDPRIRLIERPHVGVCAARNAGLSAAQGEYIAFLDSDNVWAEYFLATMVGRMQTDGLQAAHGTLEMASPQGRRYRAGQTDPEALAYANQVDLNVLVVGADLMAQIGGFDVSLRRMVDYDLVLRIVARVPLVHVPAVGAIYDDQHTDDRITLREPVSWAEVVRLKHWVDWSDESLAQRDPDLLSVILPVARANRLRARLRTLRELPQDVRWEVIVVDRSPRRRVLDFALSALVSDERIHYVRVSARDSFLFAADVGVGASHGAQLLVLEPDTLPRRTMYSALLDAAAGVTGPFFLQPINEESDRRATGFMMRAVDFIGLRGLDPLVEDAQAAQDLALRLAEAEPGAAVTVVPDAPARAATHDDIPEPSDAAQKIFADRHGTSTRWP